LFNTTWNNPTAWINGNQTLNWEAISPEVGTLWAMEVRQHYGVSFETGELLWGPTSSQNYRDQFYITGSSIAYGNLYASGIGGTLYCYDVMTGRLNWKYDATDNFAEFKISPNWWLYITFISEGKIYVGHYEHSSGDPKPRGAPFLCFNATDGELIWSIDGAFRQTMWGSPGIIGDSIIATMDTYDQRIYAIGKGPSAITVNASPKVSTHGSSVLIEGMVTDVSPGTEDYVLRARFPNGVPVIADEFMSDWMLYVYKQFSVPYAALGVDLLLEAFDSNGNYYEIGNVTSDASGMFKMMWKPPVEGAYTIAARFEGTNSYWGSYAETAIGVSKAVSPTTPIESEESISKIISIGLVIITAVAVTCFIGVAIYLVLRRRK
jgi:hypothetical protein